MKKSEKYRIAMLAVINDNFNAEAETKLEVIEMLMHEKTVAEMLEKTEEEK